MTPPEFTAEAVKQRSPENAQLFTHVWGKHSLEESLFANNPWLKPPAHDKPLEWGAHCYWDTTIASRHPYWRDAALPRPTKDMDRMRRDILEWGYCLIEDAMSAAQTAVMRDRLLEQAAAERLAGIEQHSPYGQYVNTLVNKGECFARAIEHDPAAVQAGPVIEQLIDEMLGPGWICHAFLANGADPGGYPQGLHVDQGALLPWLPRDAPMLVNTMYFFQDVDDRNGGTLMIPGSHRTLAEAGESGDVGKLPPPFNLDAPAGAVMVFDGRLLHGTGANRTSRQRFVATMSAIKPWMRQQENWVISVKPEVLAWASPKLLHRMGFQAVFNGGTVEGFGINYANGAPGDPMGAILAFRQAMDAGEYRRVGELRPDLPPSDLQRNFTLRKMIKNKG
jgi:ectoine hydroxylase-related dioxygenase (phytanoyl-CoA dioxygenase family)